MKAEDVLKRIGKEDYDESKGPFLRRYKQVQINSRTEKITGYCYNNCDLVHEQPEEYDACSQFALGEHGYRLVLHYGADPLGSVPSIGVYELTEHGWVLDQEPTEVFFPEEREKREFRDLEAGQMVRWEDRKQWLEVVENRSAGWGSKIVVKGPKGGQYTIIKHQHYYRLERHQGSGLRRESQGKFYELEIQ